jgi:hypothetical protein
MYAVCRAFVHYGRVDPSDEWLSNLQCHDGLIIEKADEAGSTTYSADGGGNSIAAAKDNFCN